jgi:hypothetical protein
MDRRSFAGAPDRLRIRVKIIPALRYEGFDLSSLRVGHIYDLEHRLAELLIDSGFAEPVTLRSKSDLAADKREKP